jgi:hypothetical protein
MQQDRRTFLKTLTAGTLAALAASEPRTSFAADKPEPPAPLADSMILLWMGGAMGQTETFDPKRHTPYEPGLETKKLICTFPTIDTSVDNIKFCQGVEKIASVIDRGTLIRSYVARDYGTTAENLQHIPYQVKWHTGYAPPQTVNPPFIGAWISKVLGQRNADLPAYIDACRPEDTGNVFLALPSFNASGFLGSEHGPLLIPDASRGQEILRSRIKLDRFENRYQKFRQIAEASPAAELTSSYQKESMVRAMENAYRLMNSPAATAFDLSK